MSSCPAARAACSSAWAAICAPRASHRPTSSWIVAIADPLDPSPARKRLPLGRCGRVELANQADVDRSRRTSRHHLIDPRTGVSAASGVAGVTVVAAQGWRAEVLAKAAFLAGPLDGPALIAQSGAAGIVVADDGSVHPAGNIDEFLRPASTDAGR